MSARGALVHRLAWGAIALLAWATLALARALVPSPRGLGTHVALGLAPCGLWTWLHIPCPACGLTTSFAHVARLELGLALAAHVLGPPLFALTAVLALVSAHAALVGEPLPSLSTRVHIDRWALGLMLALLATWVARLLAAAL